jgi:3-isopropylmalate dehydrogenase
LITENLFGDILTDEVCYFRFYGINAFCICWRTFHCTNLFGSYPQATGLNIAKLATVLSAAMMFEDAFGLKEEANAIRAVVNKLRTRNCN